MQSSFPTREVPVFNGDLLSYCPFIQTFKHYEERKTDRLYFHEPYALSIYGCTYGEANHHLCFFLGNPYHPLTARDLPDTTELDTPPNIQLILPKLP